MMVKEWPLLDDVGPGFSDQMRINMQEISNRL